ncbi:hypothetical protein [Pelosinus sp. IPA-1]|nr:hypothetical protein [Pelosinus sp. IPA-1]GMA99513.1 hypothetical protein PIPA1_23130 [Pelosinus sp. IPA-1]
MSVNSDGSDGYERDNIKEKEWCSHPIVIFAGILVLYTATSSIITLLACR